MFGTYDESAKVVEKIIKLYQSMPMTEGERETAVNALMTVRAAILHEEEQAIGRCEHFFEGDRFPKDKTEFDELPYDVRHVDMYLKSQEANGGH